MRFEFRFGNLKSISGLILFVYKLMIGSSRNSTENYTRKCFRTREKESRVNFNPGLSANRPSNNSAQIFFESFQRYAKKGKKSKFWMKSHQDRW